MASHWTHKEAQDEVKKLEAESKEDSKMTQVTNFKTADGTIYERTEGGYFYKSTGGVDKKGNPLMMRISKAVFEQAFDQYVEEARAEQETESWEKEADKDHEEQEKNQNKIKAESEKNDHEAEEHMNKKSSKKRAPRNKDLAAKITFEGKEIGITEKQKDFMLHLPDTDFWEHGLDSCIWIDVLADEIGGQFAGKKMTVGAMVSTLREKGLVNVGREKVNGKCAKSMALTGAGKAMAEEIGLK